MITYCLIKYVREEVFDYGELAFYLFLSIFAIIFDILLLLIQPIFYIIVKSWEKDEEDD